MGHHYRDRTCTDPSPKYNGKVCFGPGSDIMTCFKVPCSALIPETISLKNGYLLYRKRGKPAGFFSLYLQFKTRYDDKGRILKHKYNGCTTVATCESSISISIQKRKLNVSIQQSDSVISMSTKDDSVKKDKWHTIYLHLSENKVFLRVDDDEKYEKALKFYSKMKINFDGYTQIGNFSGMISTLRINLKKYSLKKLNGQRLASPLKESKDNNEVVKISPDSKDAIVGYSVFRGNSFIKIPLKESKTLDIEIVFFPTSPNGILMFNKGQTAGSYMYLVILKNTLTFCISDSKNKTCEDIININVYKWYHLGVYVDSRGTEIRINKANAIQISFSEDAFVPVENLCIGAGEKPDSFVFLMVLGTKEGFQGVIHEIVINGLKYEISQNPIINDRDILSSSGINHPESMSEIYEHRDSEVKLHCDYTQYAKMKQYNTSVEWFKEDALLQPNEEHLIIHKIPGKIYVSELTLLPSPNQTGLYACAIVQDGVFTVSHVFVLIRHDVIIEYPAVEEEEGAVEIFLFVALLLLLFVSFIAIQYSLTRIKKAKLAELRKVFVKPPQDGPITGDIADDKEKLLAGETDVTDELDTTGRTDELDTTGQTDELDTTGRTDELDTTGQSDELDTTGQTELDTTGQTEELDTTGQTEELDTTGLTNDLDTTGTKDESEDKDDESDKEDEVKNVIHIQDEESDEDVVHFDRQKSSDRKASSARQMTQSSKGSVHWYPGTQNSGAALIRSSIMKSQLQSSSQNRPSSSYVTPRPQLSMQYRRSSSGVMPQPQLLQYRPSSGIIPQPPLLQYRSSNLTPQLSSQYRSSSSAMRQLPSLTTPQHYDSLPQVRSSQSPQRILPSSRESLHSSFPEPPPSLTQTSQDLRLNEDVPLMPPAPTMAPALSMPFAPSMAPAPLMPPAPFMLPAPQMPPAPTESIIPRVLPSPQNTAISPSNSDDDNISVHSLLSIHHKSTSKINIEHLKEGD